MYKITWDKETGGVQLHSRIVEGTLGISPRPVFFEELDLLGLDKLGWSYPHTEEPIMWAVNKQYWYRGVRFFDAKGANIYTKPTLEMQSGIEPMALEPVDVKKMLQRTSDLMFVLENEAIEFIRDTYLAYAKASKTYAKADANKLDFESMAERVEKKSKQRMAVVKQDCDSFDIMPLATAEKEGKRVLLSTKIDRFIASFSGGKDSQVVLDLCTRAIPPTDFEVIYSDTGYELPPSLALYKDVESYYKKRFPSLRFLTARNHETVLNYWDKIGTPSDNHRWCCSVMKTAPLYRMLKVEGNKQAHVLTFDGVRAEESVRRENYHRLGKGKHTYIYNAHPIIGWNSIEIFLYLFGRDLPINSAYRNGKARVGCLICPFSTSWDDMIIQEKYQDNLQPFVEKLRKYSLQVKIANFEHFLSERKWKLKPLADREQRHPKVQFKTEISALNFVAEIAEAKRTFLKWLPALCHYSIKTTKKGFEGELHFKKGIFPFAIEENDRKSVLEVKGKLPNELVFLLRRLTYKTAYCVHCEVCEVDCPTGALSIVPQINIDKSKCIHCHKCFNTHDRGCVAADCIRMVTDSERKVNTKVQGYKKFGLRDEWIEEYFIDPIEFWKDNTLGTAQVDSLKAWLRDAEITDLKNNLTEQGELMQTIYAENPSLFWEIAFINLSYNSYIAKWFCSNIMANQFYNAKVIKEEISNQGFAGSISTVGNAAIALCDMMKKTPIGEDCMQGVDLGKEGLCRKEYDDISIEAVAYSIYRFATEHESLMLRVSDLYKNEEEHGVYKEFRITKQVLMKKLRTISAESNRVLVAELTMGLDHITLRDDLTPLTVLKEMIR
mgnify:FL=1